MITGQTSIFDRSSLSYPQSADDIMSLWRTFVFDPEDDADAFSCESIKSGYSFFIYSKKVFELLEGKNGMFLRLPGVIISELFPSRANIDDDKLYKAENLSTEEMEAFVSSLKKLKKRIFRSLISDTFACCNSFVQCSDLGHCIHETDRFYNGCYYRTNLEHGHVFYGKNKNV